MEESEKMVALKKAYADIILNTAKEAAARVMVSECKAVRFEKDLIATKDEALRLLLRLKQRIDSTTKEAEVTSLTQQRKIDELEAQLNEAEDVITDLRSELRWVRDKLEKVSDNPLQPLNGQIKKEDAYTHRNMTVEPIVPSDLNPQFEAVTSSDMENNPVNVRILDNRCCSTTEQTEHLSVIPNLTSTIMRSKDPELCTNGCPQSQRIHALERNVQNSKLPPLHDNDGHHAVMKNELTTETSDKVVGNCIARSPKTKIVDIMRKSPGGEVRKSFKVRKLRRRKTRFGKAKVAVRKSRPGQPKKLYRVSSLPSHCRSHSVNGNVRSEVNTHMLPSFKAVNADNGKNCSDLDEKLLHKRSLNEEENKISQEGKENMIVQARDAAVTSFLSPSDHIIKPCQPSSVVNRGVLYSFAIRGNVKSGEDGTKTTKNETKMKPLPRLDPGLTLIRSGVNLVSGSKNFTVSVEGHNKPRLVQKTEENDELRDESALVKLEGDVVENSMLVCSELSCVVVNEPVLSDSKDAKSAVETDGSPSKPDCNRVLKYTFQRKRKRESLINSGENTSPGKTIMKRRAAEKHIDAQESEKSNLINDSSRDSRRVAQVARQLISLSGKRW